MGISGGTIDSDCFALLYQRVIQGIGEWRRSLRKAFDLVSHAPLLAKLNAVGLDMHIINWLHSYLADRTPAVVINGTESNMSPVLSDVYWVHCSFLPM